MNILKTIGRPVDIRSLDPAAQEQLAKEIRTELDRRPSSNEETRASRMSVVELTIALHAVFNTPGDRIVWDVEGQGETEVLLEERRSGRGNGRRPPEVSSRTVGEGHNSTALSAALGLAVSRDLAGRNHRIIVVIDQASMAAGIVYEALNNAGFLRKNVIIVLNDHESQATRATGAIASYLTRVLTGQTYARLKEESATLLVQIPVIGESMLRLAKRAAESVKGFLLPGFLFEELGVRYIGPIDGSRIDSLIETFRSIKDEGGPILVHVHRHRREEESRSRSAGAADGEDRLGEALDAALCRVAESDPSVITVTSSLLTKTNLSRYVRRFSSRFYDVGISEGHAVTFACGAATDGSHPIVHVSSAYLQRAFDQIIHDLCIQDLPVMLVIHGSGLLDRSDPTHHGLFDLSYLRLIPNMVVMTPKDAGEIQHLLLTGIRHGGPAAMCLPEKFDDSGSLSDSKPRIVPLGQGERLMDGGDVAIVACGRSVFHAVGAARILAKGGISATVIDPRFIKPLDTSLVCEAAARTGRILTVEENVLEGGLGSAVTECLFDHGLHQTAIRMLGVAQGFIPSGPAAVLRRRYGLDAEGIARAARNLLEGKDPQSSEALDGALSPGGRVFRPEGRDLG